MKKIQNKDCLMAIQDDVPFIEGVPNWESDDFVEYEYEVIDEAFVKHDVTSYQFVFRNPEDGKHYSGWYSQSYNNGIEPHDFPLDLVEVEKVEVTSFEWRPVGEKK